MSESTSLRRNPLFSLRSMGMVLDSIINMKTLSQLICGYDSQISITSISLASIIRFEENADNIVRQI